MTIYVTLLITIVYVGFPLLLVNVTTVLTMELQILNRIYVREN